MDMKKKEVIAVNIKRRLSIMTVMLTMFLVVLSAVSFAAETIIDSGKCGANLTWELTDNGVLIISGTGFMDDYLNDENKKAPWRDKNFRSVILENGVRSIGKGSFMYCFGLTDITIPDSVVSIEDSAFTLCTGLTNVVIPDNVVRIGESAFMHCTSLTDVVVPDSVISIEDSAFMYCTSLKNIIIPDTANIGSAVFWGCSNLTNTKYETDIHDFQDIFNQISGEDDTNLNALVYALETLDESEGVITAANIGEYIGNIAYLYDNTNIKPSSADFTPEAIVESTEWGQNLTWNLSHDGVLTISGTGDMPDYYDEDAPWIGETINSVIIEKGITRIGARAFMVTPRLKNIIIPDSVVSIGENAFAYCTSLKDVVIPDSVISIEYGAFMNCTNLTDVVMSNNVFSIEDAVFMDCSSLKNITIPDTTKMGLGVFWGCSNLSNTKYETEMPDFQGMYNQISGEDYTIPYADDKKIADSNLIEAILDLYTFDASEGNSADIGKNIGIIGDFYGVDMDSVYNKEPIANSGKCGPNLTWKFSEDGVLTISGTGPMDDYSSIVYSDGRTSFPPWYEMDVRSVIIENGVTSIGNGAFMYRYNLTDVVIPNSVISIGDDAFLLCYSLTNIMIPDSVVSIGKSAFTYCSSLNNLIIPNSIVNIGEYAFEGTPIKSYLPKEDVSIYKDNIDWKLEDDGVLTISGTGKMNNIPWSNRKEDIKTVIIEDGVTSISDYAFSDCNNLKSIYISESVAAISYSAFENCTGLMDVTIPCSIGSSTALEECSNLTNLTITGLSGITGSVIDSRMIPSNGSLKNVIIKDGVTGIGYGAFSNCTGLKTIEIPDSVTSIGDYAFYECISLEKVIIPNKVTTIGDYAFYDCTNLTDVRLSNFLTSIGNYTFCKCVSLENIIIPYSVRTIGYESFSGCTRLNNIIIPNNVISIYGRAFSGCANLTNIIIPENVNIADSAFDGTPILIEENYNKRNVENGNIDNISLKISDYLNNSDSEDDTSIEQTDATQIEWTTLIQSLF